MKKAFTMLELIFVIVVIGILAAVIIPNTKTNSVAEAAVDLVSRIQYTKHLALVDDKYDRTNPTWMRNRWQIVLSNNKYSIVSDNNTTYAKDPALPSKDIKDIDLNDKYTVTMALSGGCNGQTAITFDNLGRPMIGNISNDVSAYVAGQLMTATCVITLSQGTKNAVIHIEPETGYAHIIN
jgi:prepilin-type N-terminal cleavage/methylation domain-containing protein